MPGELPTPRTKRRKRARDWKKQCLNTYLVLLRNEGFEQMQSGGPVKYHWPCCWTHVSLRCVAFDMRSVIRIPVICAEKLIVQYLEASFAGHKQRQSIANNSTESVQELAHYACM